MSEPHETDSHVSYGQMEYQSADTTSGATDEVAELGHRLNRLSAYSYSNLPEVVHSSLPEVVPSDTYHGLQAIPPDANGGRAAVQDVHKETANGAWVIVEHVPERYDERRFEDGVPVAARSPYLEKPDPVKGGRLDRGFYGTRVKWALLGVALLVLLIVILGAGLGAGLRSKNSKMAQKDSESGAFNGTKISLVTQTFTGDETESLVMYFQHWTGEIRWMRLGSDGAWTGGDASTVVASNAKNNTPISVVSYVWDGVSFWRVFYIDNLNIVTEVWAGNNTQGWALGPLDDLSITAMDHDKVGLVACWDGPTSPKEYAEGYATTTDASLLTFRLVYAQNATTFQQMSYRGDTQAWTSEQTLPNLNGHASPACYNRGQGTVDYLMVVDLQNMINVYWRDTNTNLTNTTSHPINRWTNSSIAISNVEDSATLGYTKYLYAQDQSDKMIRAYSLSFAAENTTLDAGSGFVVQGNPGLPSTGLGITARPDPKGGDDVIALYQTDGSHIGYYERDPDGISWTSANIRIPL